MWVVKLKIDGKKALLGGLCHKHAISASAQPISINLDSEGLSVYFMLFIFGATKNKSNFIKELRENKRIINLEGDNDFFIGTLKENKLTERMYRYNLVHIEPVKFDTKGVETWTIGSWSKENALSFLEGIEGMFEPETLKIAQEKAHHISLVSVHPKITDVQKRAMELAIENGYYEYPRKTELKELAKKMGVCYSTYQSHLRKAERKLIPSFFERNS